MGRRRNCAVGSRLYLKACPKLDLGSFPSAARVESNSYFCLPCLWHNEARARGPAMKRNRSSWCRLLTFFGRSFNVQAGVSPPEPRINVPALHLVHCDGDDAQEHGKIRSVLHRSALSLLSGFLHDTKTVLSGARATSESVRARLAPSDRTSWWPIHCEHLQLAGGQASDPLKTGTTNMGINTVYIRYRPAPCCRNSQALGSTRCSHHCGYIGETYIG